MTSATRIGRSHPVQMIWFPQRLELNLCVSLDLYVNSLKSTEIMKFYKI